MATGTMRATNIGLQQKQKLLCGLSSAPCKYCALDGDGSALNDEQTTPSQELTTNGASRKEMSFTDISVLGTTYGIEGTVDYEFTGDLTIRGVAICFGASPGTNMYARGLFTAAQIVGSEDALTVKFRDYTTRAT